MGQALHGVQDFYAHTNYIELVAPHASKVTDIKLVLHWKDSGRNHIAALREAGLVSGVVWWGLPKKCPSGTETHSDLAKDNAKTDSGKIRIANLRNITQYQIAEFLARETSLKLMEHAYDTWPILREASGDHVAFETMVDRRKENF